MESTVRKLDPEFNLLEGLFAKAGDTLKAVAQSDFDELAARLKYESLLALRELPDGLSRLMHRMRSEGLALSFHHSGPDEIQQEVNRASNKISLALITLGLYITAFFAHAAQHRSAPCRHSGTGRDRIRPGVVAHVAGSAEHVETGLIRRTSMERNLMDTNRAGLNRTQPATRRAMNIVYDTVSGIGMFERNGGVAATTPRRSSKFI